MRSRTGFVLLFALCSEAVGSELPASGQNHFFVTKISPQLEIVTQVSKTNPFVGEQFSVLYTLRAGRAPSAVDVDPQQYSGFWSEPVPLPEQAHTVVRSRDGRRMEEYILRQMIVFPLLGGALDLPPLRVKIKYGASSNTAAEDWDVIGTSESVHLRVAALPQPAANAPIPLLAGELQGALSDGSATRSEVILELKGTANLAWLQPEDWIKLPAGVRFSFRLQDWDNTIQTRDDGTTRTLRLLQRRRWSIRPAERLTRNVVLNDIVIPVFRPEEEKWSFVRIPGREIKGSASPVSLPEGDSNRSSRGAALRKFQPSVTMVAVIAAGLLLVFVGLMLIRRSRSLDLSGSDSAERAVTLLERKLRTSPRSFLDMAHKVLVQRGGQGQLHTGSSDPEQAAFDDCWRTVERWRFSSVKPSRVEQVEILNAVKALLSASKPSGSKGGEGLRG